MYMYMYVYNFPKCTCKYIHPSHITLIHAYSHINFTLTHTHTLFHPQVRWKFNDLTHGRSLIAVIVDQLAKNSRGKLYLVQLWDETSPQRLDVGASVLAVAEAVAGANQVSSTVDYGLSNYGFFSIQYIVVLTHKKVCLLHLGE